MVCTIKTRGTSTIVHGGTALDIPAGGFSISELRYAYRDVLNVGQGTPAYVRGLLVDDDYVVQPWSYVEFVADWGRKGATKARAAYYGSDSGMSRSVCRTLEKSGGLGRIAAELFRVQKASSRAKVYRGGIRRGNGHRQSFRTLAYGRKNQGLAKLAALLQANNCGLVWGWAKDPGQFRAKFVLYIDLPQGQVSFHSTERFAGPDYPGRWDQQHLSETRIIELCDTLLSIAEQAS